MSERSTAEEFLIREQLVGRRSDQRRAALGCLGCIWAQRETKEQPAFATVTEVASCTDIPSGSIANILKQLRETKVLSAQMEQGETRGSSHLQYAPVDTKQGRQFRAALGSEIRCQNPPKEPSEAATVHTPSQTAAELVDTLRARRIELGLLQKDFAEATGVQQTTLSKQETHKHMMDLADFVTYAGALGLRVVLEPIEPVDEPLQPASD